MRLLCVSVVVLSVFIHTSTAKSEQNIDEGQLRFVLTKLLEASSNGFTELRAGSGREIAGTTTYPCSMPLPGASETVIKVQNDLQPYVIAEFYLGENKSEGKKIYADLVGKVRSILSHWTDAEKDSDDNKHVDYFPRGPADADYSRVSLQYQSYKSSGRCRVSLTVWSRSLTPQPTTEKKKSVPWQGGSREEITRQIIKQFLSRDFDGIRARFNSQLITELSSQSLEQVWNQVIQQAGELKRQEEPQSRTSRGYEVVAIVCQMERGAVQLEVYFDTNSEIAGLWLRPAGGY